MKMSSNSKPEQHISEFKATVDKFNRSLNPGEVLPSAVVKMAFMLTLPEQFEFFTQMQLMHPAEDIDDLGSAFLEYNARFKKRKSERAHAAVYPKKHKNSHRSFQSANSILKTPTQCLFMKDGCKGFHKKGECWFDPKNYEKAPDYFKEKFLKGKAKEKAFIRQICLLMKMIVNPTILTCMNIVLHLRRIKVIVTSGLLTRVALSM